jgi:hypothetical protein
LRSAVAPAAQSQLTRLYALLAGPSVNVFARTDDGTESALTLASAIVPATIKGIYGDGSDGAVTYAVNTTLTRDVYATTLTVNAGVTLITAGYRLFAKTSIVNNGTIHNNGRTSGTSSGTSTGALGGVFDGGQNGGSGGVGAGGAGVAATNAPQGDTATGGTGGAASAAGGVGGSTTSATYSDFRSSWLMVSGQHFRLGITENVRGGPGGGGGSGNGVSAGAAGGGGGGIVLLCANSITNNGLIQARGGVGSNAVNANTGGGGGGGGGVAMVLTESYSGALPDVSGGAAGTSNGTAGPATAGTAGIVIGPMPG